MPWQVKSKFSCATVPSLLQSGSAKLIDRCQGTVHCRMMGTELRGMEHGTLNGLLDLGKILYASMQHIAPGKGLPHTKICKDLRMHIRDLVRVGLVGRYYHLSVDLGPRFI